MTKKKQTAIVKEMNWTSSKNPSPSDVGNKRSHFTLIDARDLFCKGKKDPQDSSKLILKIIYINKNSNQSNNNNN